MAMSMSLFAQLTWDTEMTKDDFDNAQTVISKTDNVSFSNPVLGLGGGLSIGKIVIIGTYDDDDYTSTYDISYHTKDISYFNEKLTIENIILGLENI